MNEPIIKKPSICFVSIPIYHLLEDSADSKFCGGAELQQFLIGKELAARGYSVTFITSDLGPKSEQNLGPFRVLGAFKPHSGLPILRFFHPRWTGISNALRRANSDIYYMRGAGFILFPIVMHAKLTGKRVVFAGASDADFNPKSRKIQYARDRFLYWMGLRSVDAVVAQNQTQAKRSKDILGKNAVVIHNGLPDSPNRISHSKDVLWVGNIRPVKSPERFVDLAEIFPEQPFVMVGGILGRKPYPLGPTTSEGIPTDSLSNIQYTGYLPPSEVDHFYGRARILVNTSDEEGFPNTFLHAWSWGVPVLSFVDPDSIIEKNNLGWIAQTPEEMKQILKQFLDGELEYSPQRIAEFFKSECTTNHQVDSYESVFARLLESK